MSSIMSHEILDHYGAEDGTSTDVVGDVIYTLYNHSHDVNGAPLPEHCCGCWNVMYDATGLYVLCNECGERREINDEMTALVRELEAS